LGSRIDEDQVPETTGPRATLRTRVRVGPSPESATHGRRTVRGRWRGGYRVDLDVRNGRFLLPSDERTEDGGTDTGPMPSELLFASIASCFAMAITWVARKRRLELPDLEVAVSGVHDRQARRYREIEIVAVSSLAATDPTQFDLVAHLAEEVCWVTRTIESGIGLRVRTTAPHGGADT
jgi:putative redox protein